MSGNIGVTLHGDPAPLQTALAQGGAAVEKFGASANKTLKRAEQDTLDLHKTLAGLGGQMGTALTAGFAVAKVYEFSRSMIDAQVNVDRLRNSLSYALGDGKVGQELDYLRKTTNTLGLEFNTASQMYVKFAAAAKGSAIEGKGARDVFESIGKASTVMGLGVGDVNGIMLALTQIMSKGKVQAEEIRGQLGERLPGAFAIAARAMGVTTGEFSKMLELGQVVSEDFLPKFAAALDQEFSGGMAKAAMSMQANLNLMSNAWTQFKTTLAEGGAGDAIKNEVVGITNDVSGLTDALKASQAAGDGLAMQLANATGFVVGKATMGALSLTANTLNGTLNFLTGGIFDLNTNVNLLPESLMNSEQKSRHLTEALKAAEVDLSELSAKLAIRPESIYLNTEAHQAWLLVQELRAAKTAQDALSNHSAPKSQSESRIKAQNALSAQVEKDRAAVDELMTRLSGVPQGYITTMKQIAALHSSGALVGDEYARALDNAHKLLGKPAAEKISEAAKALAFYNDLMDQSSGYTKTYAEDQNKLALAFKTGSIKSYAEYTVAVNKLLEKQPFMVALTKEQTDAIEREADATIAAGKAQAKHLDTLQSGLEKLKTSTAQQEDHNAAIGLGKDALLNLEAARLTDQAATLDGIAIKTLDKNLDYAQYELYKSQAAELRNLAALKIAGAQKQVATDAAKDMAKEQKKAAEESAKHWEDALMRAFESGKGFFESLWDAIKNTLKTQVLKVLIAPIAGAASGLASAATTAGGSMLGSLTGGALGTVAGSTAGSIANLIASPSMGALDIAGIGLGPIGWAATAAAALYAIFGNKKTPSAGTGEGNATFDAAGAVTGASSRYTGGWGLTDQVGATLADLQASYAGAARALGIATVATEFAFGGNTGKEGKDPQFALGVNAGGVSYSSGEIKLTDANVQLAASRAVFAALQGSDLPAYLVGAFDDLVAASATQEQITGALNQASAVKTFHEAVQDLPFDGLKNLSFDASVALGQASGGLDVLVASLTDMQAASATARAGIAALVDGIDAKVSASIFGMQYGLEDDAGKYSMLDVRAARLNDQMLASTDLAAVAKLAEEQITTINQAWELLSADQQRAQYLEFESRLNKVDDLVTARGADALSLQQAADDRTAKTIADAVEAAVAKALANPAAAMQAAADKADKPIEVVSNVNVNVTAPAGAEVSISQ